MAPLRKKLHKLGQNPLLQRVAHKFKRPSSKSSSPQSKTQAPGPPKPESPVPITSGKEPALDTPATPSALTQPSTPGSSTAAGSKRTSYGSASTSNDSDMSHEYTMSQQQQQQQQQPQQPQPQPSAGNAPSCLIDLTAEVTPEPPAHPGCSANNPIDLTGNVSRTEDVTMTVDESSSSAALGGHHRRRLSNFGRRTKESHSAPLAGADARANRAVRSYGKRLSSLKCGDCGHGLDWEAADVVASTKEMLVTKG